MAVLVCLLLPFAIIGIITLVTMPFRIRREREDLMVIVRYAAVVKYGENGTALDYDECQHQVTKLAPSYLVDLQQREFKGG